MMRLLVFFVLTTLGVTEVIGSEEMAEWVRDCGSLLDLKSIEIDGCCSRTGECVWLENQVIELSYLYNNDMVPPMSSLTNNVVVSYMGSTWPMKVQESSPNCIVSSCPFDDTTQNRDGRYNLSFYFDPPAYGTVDVIANMSIFRPDEVVLSCIRFSVTAVYSPDSETP